MAFKLNRLLRNNWFTISFQKNLNYNLNPEEIVKESPFQFLKQTLKITSIFLIFYIVVNLIFSLLNLDYLLKYGDVMENFYKQGKISWSLYLMNVFPYSVFFLAFFFMILQIISAFISYGAMWILGEPTRSFLRLLGIYHSSCLYILFALLPILVLFQFVPKNIQENFYGMVFFIGLNAALLLIGFFAQSYFFIKMCKRTFDQNLGRAILTLLSPFLLLSILVISSFN
ncbi:hypothetical protein [Leptospira weilii]|uniref:Yip1 domain protein n=1 Tax=Leptospira weilii str. UI 13098 TaxID=1088542 RepID=M6QKW0_9LEPT|nr:hypothetical protein [Leptospira weilii]EMN89507.1 hypothetical protein LEP1GSC108_0012 [Leptospira weilii str. UI 13098]